MTTEFNQSEWEKEAKLRLCALFQVEITHQLNPAKGAAVDIDEQKAAIITQAQEKADGYLGEDFVETLLKGFYEELHLSYEERVDTRDDDAEIEEILEEVIHSAVADAHPPRTRKFGLKTKAAIAAAVVGTAWAVFKKVKKKSRLSLVK